MELTKLKQICENGCAASNLFGMIPTTITPHTVRTKGQYAMQRLFYIREGVTEFVLNDGRTLTCKKGDIVYLPPDVSYESHWEGSDRAGAILLRFDLFCAGEPITLFDDILIIAQDPYGEYLEHFLRFHKEFERGLPGYKIKCHSIFLELLHLLVRELLRQESVQKSDSVYRAIFYIENHYQEKLCVEDLAKMCSLCPSAFRSHFRAATGLSPVQYKNRLMMKKAAELLRTGDFSVSEVARMLGIEDIYYFNRMFKQFYQTPPGKFKASGAESALPQIDVFTGKI